MRESLLEHVDRVLRRAIPGGSKGVVAVSGGADSVALLRLLAILHGQRKIAAPVVAHVNHQLRGAESDADETFVAALANSLDVTFRVARIDMAERARKHHDNLEAAARQARYNWLAQIAHEESASWIATGHTADDQAETVLHHLLRGTGLHGLCGIPERRGLRGEGREGGDLRLIRPLLDIHRAALLSFLEEIGQSFRVDSSNVDLGFTRNRIRHELLPELAEKYNPAIASVLCRLAQQAADAQQIVVTAATKLLKEAELPRAGGLLIFQPARLAASPRHLVREMFRLVWQRESWPEGQMGFDEWQRLAALAGGEEATIDLPGKIRARKTERTVQIGLSGAF